MNQTQNLQRILDYGAGMGTSAANFERFFPDTSLTCLDVSEMSLEVGRSRFPGFADLQSFDGIRIPSPDNAFDQVFADCAIPHINITPYPCFGLLREWLRVLKTARTAVIFEHNPLNPPTVHAVKAAPFDKIAELILRASRREEMQKAGFQSIGLLYSLFVPRALRALRTLERGYTGNPLGCSIFHSRNQTIGELI